MCFSTSTHSPSRGQSLGESVTAISPSTPQRLRLSECLEALLPMECVPEISLCLEPALNRGSSPLAASAVTQASTSLHTGPPFTVTRLVRELMSVRVHAARFLSPASPISCSIRGTLTPFSRAPTWFTLISFWTNCELNVVAL